MDQSWKTGRARVNVLPVSFVYNEDSAEQVACMHFFYFIAIYLGVYNDQSANVWA